MVRKCTPEQINALKTAFKLVVSDVGGLEAAAACTRLGKSQLAEYGNINSEKMITVDVVLDLEAIGGAPHVTAAMAAAHGLIRRNQPLNLHEVNRHRRNMGLPPYALRGES